MNNRNSRQYTSSSIKIFYKIASLLECVALSDVLDYVAPFNVEVVTNNAVTRFFIPNFAGKSISSKVFKASQNFLFEDTP
jgi:hypothetical protein